MNETATAPAAEATEAATSTPEIRDATVDGVEAKLVIDGKAGGPIEERAQPEQTALASPTDDDRKRTLATIQREMNAIAARMERDKSRMKHLGSEQASIMADFIREGETLLGPVQQTLAFTAEDAVKAAEEAAGAASPEGDDPEAAASDLIAALGEYQRVPEADDKNVCLCAFPMYAGTPAEHDEAHRAWIATLEPGRFNESGAAGDGTTD